VKRLIFLFVAGIITASFSFAENAEVLPARTLRVDADADFGFIREGWDDDGKKTDAPDAVVAGTALGISYGFTEWFTAVFDWFPGLADADLIGVDFPDDGDGEVEIYEGLSDFSLKARFQVIGDSGLLKNQRFRLRLSPGIMIPFPGIDDKDALGNHAWGPGVEVSADAFIIDDLFINAACDFYWFPFDNKLKTNNEWELTLESGPHYRFGIGVVDFVVSLPINWKAAQGNGMGETSHLLTLRPALELKLTRPFTVDIGIEYAFPVHGKNNYATHTITIKAPVYFTFDKNNVKE
jgi:hypothetical protein